MKNLKLETIGHLFGGAFFSAIVCDATYGSIAYAKLFLIGTTLIGLSGFLFTLGIITSIIYLMFNVIFKDLFDSTFHSRSFWEQQDYWRDQKLESKPKHSKKPSNKAKKGSK